jgi:hypothetical protein
MNMKRLLLPLAALTIAGFLLPTSAQPAYACSVGPDFDPIASSDVIVAGRITGWELITDFVRWDPKQSDQPLDDPRYYGPHDPIRLELAVERVYKGGLPATIEMVTANTLMVSTQDGRTHYEWVGAIGSCGAFDFDPTGKYVVMGLSLDQHGRYSPTRPLTFFIGDDPPESYDGTMLRVVAPLLPGTLPTSGGLPPDVTPSSPAVTPPALLALGLALAAGGGVLTLRALRKI